MSEAGNPTYPVKTIAKLLMLTERRVQQLTKDGVIPKADRGRYELAPAVQGYVRFLQDRMAGNAGAGPSDYQTERTRKIKAEADIAEMEAMRLRGELFPVAVVSEVMEEMCSNIKSRLLAMPTKLAHQVAGRDSVAEVQALLEQQVGEALQEIYSDGIQGIADKESGESLPRDTAAAAADG